MKKRTFLTSVAVLATNLLLNNSGLALPNNASIKKVQSPDISISNSTKPFVLTNSDNDFLLARGHSSHSSHRSHSSHSSHYSGSGGYTPSSTYTAPNTYQTPSDVAPNSTSATPANNSIPPTNTIKNTGNSIISTDTVPQFKNYPVEQIYTNENHPLILNEFGKKYKTRLSYALKHDKPNFAGHYIVVTWGCGTGGCNTGAVVDAITGEAYPFPISISSVSPLKPEYENDNGQELIYKLKSRIIVFAGNLDGSTNGNGEDTIEFYEFKDGEFVFLKSIPYGKKLISN